MAAREARGFPEGPALRLTPGADLEVAGLIDQEEEEEDEEEAAARRALSFARDSRVRFLGGCLELMLGLPAEKWSQYLESEDHRQVLGEFLESPSPACLVFSVAAAGPLAVSREVRDDGQRDLVSPSALHSRDRPVAPPWVPVEHALGRFKKLSFELLLWIL